jgi:hypothetical protein
MRKNSIKILFLAFSLMFAACEKKNTPSQTGGIFTFDETKDAGDVVKEANEQLKQIKQRFKDNEPRLAELQAALKEKNAEKVRSISDQLVTEIDAGTRAGEEAVNKLRTAQEKNINEDYREYLSLKIQALEKYVEAFEERRQVAIFLREKYDPKSDAQRKIFKDEFDKREEKFKEIMEEARQSSEEANQLAKESLNRKS